MRALLQRVTQASVSVDDTVIAQTGPGLLIFVCAMQNDTLAEAATLASKVAKLRIFRDNADKMNRSLVDTGGAALIVSQFTLAADTTRGNRPGFSAAADPATGQTLYQAFADQVRAKGIPVATGRFGADMAVALVNDGPITLWLDTAR
ncbi:D-aminoacyl-tRNA deacylase [Puniceibacterium sp. IMCC21224]|uniref:D-aminoacyl-tRNA deacylase n=1 Tax=Puniceibacterium sp. IMCC21224 TaxID=1618204 RepID=UPI00064DC40D|nr:D-aminoacyl-tRNA deacylase [Puniceibacterium sp. IMCC21224]KMK66743.1 D-tyrosyl-tRNA(Tyr) deacylase [Puniceibacterium sp. IMCC21224]